MRVINCYDSTPEIMDMLKTSLELSYSPRCVGMLRMNTTLKYPT